MKKDKVELGDKVQDIVTGLEGITVARTEYLYDCVQFTVKPPYNKKKGEQPKSGFVDEPQLVILEKGVIKKREAKFPPQGGEREHPGE